jgi:hypothetical protein
VALPSAQKNVMKLNGHFQMEFNKKEWRIITAVLIAVLLRRHDGQLLESILRLLNY